MGVLVIFLVFLDKLFFGLLFSILLLVGQRQLVFID